MEQTRTKELSDPMESKSRTIVAALLRTAALIFAAASVLLAGLSGFWVGGPFDASIWSVRHGVPVGPIVGSMVGCSLSVTRGIVSCSFGTRRFGWASIVLGAVFWTATAVYLPGSAWLAFRNNGLLHTASLGETIALLGALTILEVAAGTLPALALDEQRTSADRTEITSSTAPISKETKSRSPANDPNERSERVLETLRSILNDQCSGDPDGWAQVSQRKLAQTLNCAVSSVNGHLHALEAKGIIELRTKPRTRFRFRVHEFPAQYRETRPCGTDQSPIKNGSCGDLMPPFEKFVRGTSERTGPPVRCLHAG